MALIAYFTPSQLSTLSGLPPQVTDSTDGYFVAVNSWGPGWGDNGFLYISEKHALFHGHSFLEVIGVDLKQ